MAGTKPGVARMYDAILCGKDNFAADRAVADMAHKASPDGGRSSSPASATCRNGTRTGRSWPPPGISELLYIGGLGRKP